MSETKQTKNGPRNVSGRHLRRPQVQSPALSTRIQIRLLRTLPVHSWNSHEIPAPLQSPIPAFSPHSQASTFPVCAGFPMCSMILRTWVILSPPLFQPHPEGPQTRPTAQTGHPSAEHRGQSLPLTLLLMQPKPPLTSGDSWSPSCPQGFFCKAASSSNPRAGLVFASAEHHRVPITVLLQPVMVLLKSRAVTSLLHLASPTAQL